MNQLQTNHPIGELVANAPETDQSLTDRVNRLQSELVDLRSVLEPFLNPSSPECERDKPDKNAISGLENWLGSLVEANDVSLNILQDIRERLYIPSVFPQDHAPQAMDDRKAL